TKKDLIKYAWVKPENILVLENQIDFNPIKTPTKKENQFVYVGRLTPSKRIHDCIKAMSLVDNKKTKLIIIGSGNEKYKRRLEHLTKKLNLTNRVIFTGNINNKERNKLMQQSLAILVTSVREGWGLIVTEANANGTLAITYNVPGLVDANKTGIITKNNTSKELAICMSNLINNPKIRKEKEAKALKFAREHNDWSKNINKLNSWLIGGNKHG
ncbi:MAG: glycosyltransferase, partial [Candidatus Pacearchaeota archaeon]